jgi:hypothetical protein
MLVTFHSQASGSVTMFGDVAITLLRMMGHSGTVPSALRASDIPPAITRLQQQLAVEEHGRPDVQPDDSDPDVPPPVALRVRAHPLIELLSTAAREGCDVMWEEGSPLV